MPTFATRSSLRRLRRQALRGVVLTLLLFVWGCQRGQNVASVWALWTPGELPLEIEDFAPQNVLTDIDRQLFRTVLERGHVRVVGSSGRQTLGLVGAMFPQTRTIVVFTGPLSVPVRLEQALGSTVLHVQNGRDFDRYPEGSSAPEFVVHLEPHDAKSIRFWREIAGNRTDGGSIGLLQY